MLSIMSYFDNNQLHHIIFAGRTTCYTLCIFTLTYDLFVVINFYNFSADHYTTMHYCRNEMEWLVSFVSTVTISNTWMIPICSHSHANCFKVTRLNVDHIFLSMTLILSCDNFFFGNAIHQIDFIYEEMKRKIHFLILDLSKKKFVMKYHKFRAMIYDGKL